MLKARAWAAPQVERTGQVIQDTVAPKVAEALTASARRIDPEEPKRGRWRMLAGLAALLAAAGVAVAAWRNRTAPSTTTTSRLRTSPFPLKPSEAKADAAHTS